MRNIESHLLHTLFILILIQEGRCDRRGSNPSLPAHKRQSVQYSTLVGPSFLNVSAHAHTHARTGHTAYLTCLVRNLHNYTVSWVRARDIHLLATGETTYTSDHRFVAVNPEGGTRWVLRIHNAQAKDRGIYLCQVSVTPPISTPVTLLVTDATSLVFPGSEVFLRASSRLVLVCEVRGCPLPADPAWTRGGKVEKGTQVEEFYVTHSTTSSTPIYQDTNTITTTTTTTNTITATTATTPQRTQTSNTKNSTNTITASHKPNPTPAAPKITTTTITTTTTTAPPPIGLPIARVTLTRPMAKSGHSGIYTCINSCTNPANLTLHVLIGDEETAAMQHLSAAPIPHCLPSLLLPVTSLIWMVTS